MPYVWDGHDNATRVEETGHGFKMHRSNWQPEELKAKIDTCLTDADMKAKMAATSAHMQQFNGPERAAGLLDQLLKDHG
jgi:UDP:flavonoid glycosyltransferase YjiC (YdhE family)